MAKKKRGKEEGGAAAALARKQPTGPAAEGTLPGWLPWVLYGALTLILFRAFVVSRQMLFGSDTLGLGYMARKFYADALAAGDFPLWNPNLLGGTPFLEALSGGDSLYPSALLLMVMEPYRALGWKLVIHVFLAGAFMFGWSRRLGASRPAALVAGSAYLLAPYLVTLVFPGHDGKIFVTALTPLLFWAMETTFHRRGLLPFAGVAGVVALVILTTHFQMAYFLFGAAGLYYAFRCIELARSAGGAGEAPAEAAAPAANPWPRAASRFGLFLAASVVGAAAAGIQLIPAVQYATEYSRRTATTIEASAEQNKDYAAQWSLHPEELAAMVVPEFVGSDAGGADWTTGTYWGRNAIKLNHEYVGLVVLLLAGVSLFGARRRALRWFFTVLGALALLYALGANTPVWHAAYALLPGIKLFRAASMVSFLFGFAAATLLAFGVDRLLELREGADPDDAARVQRYLWIATGVLGVGTVLAATGVLESLWTGVVYAGMDAQKAGALAVAAPFITRGFAVAMLLAAGTAGLAWAALRGTLSPRLLVGGLILLVAVDLWRVDAPFIRVMDPGSVIQPDPIVAELMKRKASEPPFRVHAFANDQTVDPAAFGIELVGGHHPNDLQRYRELIGMRGSANGENLSNPNVLSLLGVDYLIWPTAMLGGEPQDLEVVLRSGSGGQVEQSLVRYPGLPRARLVGVAEVLPDGPDLARILAPDFDPGTTVVLAEPPPFVLSGAPDQGRVEWVEHGLDRQRLTVESPGNLLLVVADNWYPAWKATVDGVEVPVLRAYHTLRALPVGPGRHDVVLWYDLGALRSGIVSTLLGLVVLATVVVVSLVRDRRRE